MNTTKMWVSMTAGLGLFGASFTVVPVIAKSYGRAYEAGRLETVRESLANTPRGAFESRIRDVAKVLRPSVVQIMPMRFVRTLNEFGQAVEGVQPAGVGSGVIVSKEGYVLTNNHVVRNSQRVEVKLADGRRLVAKVVGTDKETDLAVLDLDAEGLVPAKLGDSDALAVGDWVVAAGSPFGLEQSVSTGIVSAFGRSRVGVANYEDFIQTDAAVNPGNSGGPLVNLDGEVIGINTAIASRSGSYNGISFAIPSRIATRVLEQIVENGRVERGWLGFYIQDRPGNAKGAVVQSVITNGPAQAAGIKPGDVILSIDGQAVHNSKDLIFLVADLVANQKAKVAVERGGRKVEIEATIGSRPAVEQPRRVAPRRIR